MILRAQCTFAPPPYRDRPSKEVLGKALGAWLAQKLSCYLHMAGTCVATPLNTCGDFAHLSANFTSPNARGGGLSWNK